MSTTLTWRFAIRADDPAAVAAHIDAIMQAMLLRENSQVHDTSIGLDLSAMIVDISVTVDGPDTEGSVQQGMKAVQSALTAAVPKGASVTFAHAELVAV